MNCTYDYSSSSSDDDDDDEDEVQVVDFSTHFDRPNRGNGSDLCMSFSYLPERLVEGSSVPTTTTAAEASKQLICVGDAPLLPQQDLPENPFWMIGSYLPAGLVEEPREQLVPDVTDMQNPLHVSKGTAECNYAMMGSYLPPGLSKESNEGKSELAEECCLTSVEARGETSTSIKQPATCILSGGTHLSSCCHQLSGSLVPQVSRSEQISKASFLSYPLYVYDQEPVLSVFEDKAAAYRNYKKVALNRHVVTKNVKSAALSDPELCNAKPSKKTRIIISL